MNLLLYIDSLLKFIFLVRFAYDSILHLLFCLLSVDLVALLQKPVPHSQAAEVNSFETSQQQGFGQALVFTNSQHSNQMAQGTGISTAVNPYPPQSLVTHFYFSVGF